MKSYGGPDGSKTLWQLHGLDIEDKHRLLVPVMAAHQESIFKMSMTFMEMSSGIGPFPELPALSLKSAQRNFPLENGAVLFAYGRGPPDEDKTQRKPVIDISFGKGQTFEGEPLVPTLQQLIDFVERIIDIFERAIFR